MAQYRDPEFVERAPEGKTIKQMLLDGELDAAILGDVAEEGPIKHLIPDHADAGAAWAKRHGGVPINHLMVIRESIAEEQPEVVKAVYRLLRDSREAANAIYEFGRNRPAALRRFEDSPVVRHDRGLRAEAEIAHRARLGG